MKRFICWLFGISTGDHDPLYNYEERTGEQDRQKWNDMMCGKPAPMKGQWKAEQKDMRDYCDYACTETDKCQSCLNTHGTNLSEQSAIKTATRIEEAHVGAGNSERHFGPDQQQEAGHVTSPNVSQECDGSYSGCDHGCGIAPCKQVQMIWTSFAPFTASDKCATCRHTYEAKP